MRAEAILGGGAAKWSGRPFIMIFNRPWPSEDEKRQALLKEMFAEFGENCHIEPPLHANWAG